MSLHQKLLNMNDIDNYLGSVLIKNQNVPLFEEQYGMLDYDWKVKVAESRKCNTFNIPLVVRYVNKDNLSLNSDYRKKDFYLKMTYIDENIKTMKKLFGSRARYYFQIGNVKMARFWFLRSGFSLKIALYFIASFFPFSRKMICKKFKVFGQ